MSPLMSHHLTGRKKAEIKLHLKRPHFMAMILCIMYFIETGISRAL